jgi:hypothetical protein
MEALGHDGGGIGLAIEQALQNEDTGCSLIAGGNEKRFWMQLKTMMEEASQHDAGGNDFKTMV